MDGQHTEFYYWSKFIKLLYLMGSYLAGIFFICFNKWRTPEISCFHPTGQQYTFAILPQVSTLTLCPTLIHEDGNQIIILKYKPLMLALMTLG